MSEGQRLADQFTRYFTQKTGVFLPFSDATDGLTAAQALHVPREKFNSVWRVTNHVCYWVEADLLVIQQAEKRPDTPGRETGGWHAPESATDAEWQALRSRTIDLNNQLAAAIAALSDEQMQEMRPAWKQTCYEVGQSILAHNCYHIAEIISIRHLQGLWVEA